MRRLDETERRALLGIARNAIEAMLCPDPVPEVRAASLPPGVCEPGAAFVTLHEAGEVRGCIGELRFETAVWQNVRDAAVAAAFDDPRFPGLRRRELPLIELEISVLEPPVELPDPAAFVPGRDGVIVERGFRRALLLPQVATEWNWGTAQMLDAVCRKAGLAGDAWRDPGTRLYVFEAQVFGERDAENEVRDAAEEMRAAPEDGARSPQATSATEA